MQKIFIFGATGFFGAKFVKFFTEKNFQVFTDRVDVRDFSAVEKILQKRKPNFVLNCVGATGSPNVDWCETHRGETLLLNLNGAVNVAIAAEKLQIFCAQLMSGCIYAGDNFGKGFAETDPPNFEKSFYSFSKATAERALPRFENLILRVRIPIDSKPGPKNVIDKLLNYEKILVTPNSYTVVDDFLPVAAELISRKISGIFNCVNSGATTHQFLMEKFREIVDERREFKFIEKLQTAAPRSNCVLSTAKLENLNLKMPEIEKRIPEILKIYRKFYRG
jgi:dTDP-4-dehydrorhamnose reductase